MTDQNPLTDRRRALEEDYFRKREQELVEKLRKRGEDARLRRELGERTGVADEEILGDLRDLGYTPETVTLLHLVPLVQIAWAEGHVSDSERALIVEAARKRGVQPGSEADRQLTAWLGGRPSDEFFTTTLRAIGAMMQASAPEEREASTRDLLAYSKAIASASGGILGIGKVSKEEEQLLARIAEELKQSHSKAASAALPKE